MDFAAQRLVDGGWIRVLTVLEQFTSECLALFADVPFDRGKNGGGVGQNCCRSRCTIVPYCGQRHGVCEQSRRPVGLPLRSPLGLFSARATGRERLYRKLQLQATRRVFKRRSVLKLEGCTSQTGDVFGGLQSSTPAFVSADRTPAEFAKLLSGRKDADTPTLKNASRFPDSRRTATAGNSSPTDQPSTLARRIA